MKVIAAFLAMVILVPFSVLAVALVILDCLAKEEGDRLKQDLSDSISSMASAWGELLQVCVGAFKPRK